MRSDYGDLAFALEPVMKDTVSVTIRNLAAIVVVMSFVLGACGWRPDVPEQPDSVDHNAADVDFVAAMIVHHRQTLKITALAADSAESPQVRTIAREIEQEQTEELRQFTTWADEWSLEAAGVVASDVPGTVNEVNMARLNRTTGEEFDDLFLREMLYHAQGALDLARTQTTTGLFTPALDLAAAILVSQEAQMQRMRALQ